MSRRIARVEVAQLFALEERFLVELEEEAIVTPDRDGLYDASCVERVRVSCTLHRELGVNMAGVEVILELLERWRSDRERTRELLTRLRSELGVKPG
jgi:MerR family transcriptional regulator/heat shock protein HspR